MKIFKNKNGVFYVAETTDENEKFVLKVDATTISGTMLSGEGANAVCIAAPIRQKIASVIFEKEDEFNENTINLLRIIENSGGRIFPPLNLTEEKKGVAEKIIDDGIEYPGIEFLERENVETLVEERHQGNAIFNNEPYRALYKLEGSIISEDNPVYVLPEYLEATAEFVAIAKNIHETSNDPMGNSVRNIILEGPPGTGKSVGAKIIAHVLGLPYVHLDCRGTMTDQEILGKFQPDDKGDAVFKYVKTILMAAIKNGWVCEIVEANVLKDGAVLTALNSLFDDNKNVVLENGEVIARHPNAVVIMTMNPDEGGTIASDDMHGSIISRANRKDEFGKPDATRIIERFGKIYGFARGSRVYTQVEAAIQIQAAIERYMNNNGNKCFCSPRDVGNFVASITKNPDKIEEILKTTIVNKATSAQDILNELWDTCVMTNVNISAL